MTKNPNDYNKIVAQALDEMKKAQGTTFSLKSLLDIEVLRVLNKEYFLPISILRFAFVQITQACSKNLMDMPGQNHYTYYDSVLNHS